MALSQICIGPCEENDLGNAARRIRNRGASQNLATLWASIHGNTIGRDSRLFPSISGLAKLSEPKLFVRSSPIRIGPDIPDLIQELVENAEGPLARPFDTLIARHH